MESLFTKRGHERMTDRFHQIREIASNAFWQHLPGGPDDAWLAEVVDRPRFGWDWAALEQGFFLPLRAWAARHDARLRPVLAGLLIDAFDGDAARHGDLLTSLELVHQASIMLDDLRNGKDLSTSTAEAVTVPLPVWVTIAYNARQLAPVLLLRRASSVPEATREQLAHRFARFLFQQGLGGTLDLYRAQHASTAASLDEFIAHLSTYIGPLSFGLACDMASLLAGLNEPARAELARAGTELGVALRLGALARGEARALAVGATPVTEQLIHWRPALSATALDAAHQRLLASAVERARHVSLAAAAAFRVFIDVLQTSQHEEEPS
jgi:hypothetical protein